MPEVVVFPASRVSDHLWDDRPAQGAFMVIEVPDVEAHYERALRKGLPLGQHLTTQAWGHRSFCVREPNGLTLYLFTPLQAAGNATA